MENAHDTARLNPKVFAGRTLKESGEGFDIPESDCWLHSNGVPCWQLLFQLRMATTPANQRKGVRHLAAAGADRVL